MFERRYSMIGSLSSLTVQAAAERSAEASDSSKACSTLSCGGLPDLEDAAEKMFLLALLLDGEEPLLDRVVGDGIDEIAQRDAEAAFRP